MDFTRKEADMNSESRDEVEVESGTSTESSAEASGTDRVEAAAANSESDADTGNDTQKSPDPDEQTEAEESSDDPGVEAYYRELAEKVEQLVQLTDWPYVSMELANVELSWEDGPDPSGVDISGYRKQIDEARSAFEEKKQAHFEEQKRIREGNLEKKKSLLDDLKQIVEQEKWTATREVGKIKGTWDQVKPLPSGKGEDLQKQYDKLMAEFESHKVDRIVRKKEKEEENLVGKLLVLDKMELLLKSMDEEGEEVDWSTREKELERLNKQWHKIGRVPVEKNQDTWDRYHQAQSTFHEIRFRLDAQYRNQIEGYLKKKRSLIQEAEALIDTDHLPEASRRVNKLHRLWKKAGNLPQQEENELWDRFKNATDRFNEMKSENLDKLREQEQQNLQAREELIEKAENLKDSEDWDATHQAYQELMEQWKKTGPVPKRASGKVWKRFKRTMDHFYDRRRDHFKEIRKERKSNLDEKRDVLDKLKELASHDNPIEAVELAKPLQEEFKKAGYVPIKYKNQIWKEYREICDDIYGRFRAAKSAAELVGDEAISDYSKDELVTLQKKQKEAGRLRKEISRMNDDLLQMKESLSYFKPSGKGSSLLDGVHEKMEKLEKQIQEKEEKLVSIEREMDELGDN